MGCLIQIVCADAVLERAHEVLLCSEPFRCSLSLSQAMEHPTFCRELSRRSVVSVRSVFLRPAAGPFPLPQSNGDAGLAETPAASRFRQLAVSCSWSHKEAFRTARQRDSARVQKVAFATQEVASLAAPDALRARAAGTSKAITSAGRYPGGAAALLRRPVRRRRACCSKQHERGDHAAADGGLQWRLAPAARSLGKRGPRQI